MNEKEIIELLLARVEEMRTHQRDWFARKMPYDLQQSKAKEKEVDELCRRIRARGYNPDRFKTNIKQDKLF